MKLCLPLLTDSLVFCFLNLKCWDFTDGGKIMPQSSERLTGICAEISSSVGEITLQIQHDFDQANCFDRLMKTGLLIVFS